MFTNVYSEKWPEDNLNLGRFGKDLERVEVQNSDFFFFSCHQIQYSYSREIFQTMPYIIFF